MAISEGSGAVSEELGFDYDAEAALAAMAYLCAKCSPPVTRQKMCILLFLAEREHLLRFGRPITGDHLPGAGGDFPNGLAEQTREPSRKV